MDGCTAVFSYYYFLLLHHRIWVKTELTFGNREFKFTEARTDFTRHTANLFNTANEYK